MAFCMARTPQNNRKKSIGDPAGLYKCQQTGRVEYFLSANFLNSDSRRLEFGNFFKNFHIYNWEKVCKS
jgi:hypothetical protein